MGLVVLGGVESVLTNDLLWGVFSLFIVVVASLPAIAFHDRTAMVPWLVLGAAAIAVLARATGFYAEVAGYVAIATLALIAVVELTVFTPVELSRWFAVLFAVMTTMAIDALWMVAQFYSDQWLGTDYLTTQTELQQDIVLVTVVGALVGGAYYVFVTRLEPVGTVNQHADRAETR